MTFFKVIKKVGFYVWVCAALHESTFPKDSGRSIFFRFISVFLLSSTALFLSIFLDKQGTGFSYLVFFLSISMSAWIGGFGGGIIATLFGEVWLFLSFYLSALMSVTYLTESAFLLAVGIVVSFIIERSKQVDLVTEFNKKERAYQRVVSRLEDDNIQAKNEIKVRDEFLSIVSHELKTPLTSTLLKLQVALHNIRSVSLADFSVQNLTDMLESAEQQTQRLSKMINDLLNISLIRTKKMELEFEEADLKVVTQEVINAFAEKAERENIEINFIGDQAVIGQFDKLRVEQVITNLISNAIKYGNGKPIEVMVKKENSLAQIIIKDHGIGISRNNKDKIFDLFERGGVQDSAYQGLGVGLYITHQVVDAHRGKIKVDSQEGKGSTFIIELPLHNK